MYRFSQHPHFNLICEEFKSSLNASILLSSKDIYAYFTCRQCEVSKPGRILAAGIIQQLCLRSYALRCPWSPQTTKTRDLYWDREKQGLAGAKYNLVLRLIQNSYLMCLFVFLPELATRRIFWRILWFFWWIFWFRIQAIFLKVFYKQKISKEETI